MRRAYTLFEMLVVVALIAILAGMAIPSIEGMYADSRLQAAADQIVGQWSAMRARAITEGRPYRFSVRSGSGDFRVAPDGSDAAPASDNGDGLVTEDSLPNGINFDTVNASASNSFGSVGMSDDASGGEADSGSWTSVAVFLPDGTAQDDVGITIRTPQSGPISIKLRALTGGISTRWIPANENPNSQQP
ncbi:MAG TPA: prepilin-type N-terminal cleavage/methylation domain-containing protein [Gemmataceae bacterium]|nr:prepilin-type N-terminal cleavage/methylation domain-containing protein [Gemmataceae bacterium]